MDLVGTKLEKFTGARLVFFENFLPFKEMENLSFFFFDDGENIDLKGGLVWIVFMAGAVRLPSK